jgi:hypothetical protein
LRTGIKQPVLPRTESPGIFVQPVKPVLCDIGLTIEISTLKHGVGQNNPFGSLTFPKKSPKTGKALQKTAGKGFIVLYE